MSLKDLQQRRKALQKKTEIGFTNMDIIIDETKRVAEVAHNSENIIDNLELEFETKTGLQGNDVKFLFVAIALQLIRIYLINEISRIEVAGRKNRNETSLHKLQNKILKGLNSEKEIKEAPYYASMEHIVTKTGVPYDATTYLKENQIDRLLKRNRIWDFDISDYLFSNEDNLFEGGNHRFSTLGHDPWLGLVFGTANIMTNTITCVKKTDVGLPLLTTNHVIFTSDYKDPSIGRQGMTTTMLEKAANRAKEEPNALVASLIKQIIHIGTDMFTPCGIQVPMSNLVLSVPEVEKITKKISYGDLVKVGTSALMAEFINYMISILHILTYDSSMPITKDLFEVRTRKIIMYSNMIATGSNVLYVGTNLALGKETSIKNFDIAGLLIIIRRLTSDRAFIREVKEEFVLGSFDKMIEGEELNLIEHLD